MFFVDTHCHIYATCCDDILNTINESEKNNVKKLINCSENIETAKEILKLTKKHNNIMCAAIGIHPEYADSILEKDLKELEQMIKTEKIIAIGEIGLDYHYTKENKDKQKWLFEEQLKLAEKYNLPVIIHSREATRDTIDILKKYKVKGTIHSFSGSYETANEYIKMGYMLGINGVVTFKNANLKDVVSKIGLEHILLETDSPFLSPEPFRGKTNSPKNIPVIAEFIAKNLNISVETVMERTTNNAFEIFDI